MPKFGFLLLLSLLACSHNPSRIPQSEIRVPDAHELFLVGNFEIKRPALKPWQENHFGKPLDLHTRRPAVNLTGTIFSEKYGRAGYSLFANFYHRGHFYIARVPEVGVKNIYVQLAYFPPLIAGRYIAAHSLLRFEMNTPIELVALVPTEKELEGLNSAASTDEMLALLPDELPSSPENQIKNAAISAEAQWEKDDPKKTYNLMRGKNGAFIQIVRFESMEERLREFYHGGNPVGQYKLEDPKHPDAILSEALRTSQSDGISKQYDTLWYNCTTLAFDILERGNGYKDKRLGFVRKFLERRVPVIAPSKIKKYGGIEISPMQLDPSLKEESQIIYERYFGKTGHPLCPEKMKPKNCENLREAVKTIGITTP